MSRLNSKIFSAEKQQCRLIGLGRNRYRACQETSVEPIFAEYGGYDPLGYVISLNLHRRHLNESQRGMVEAKIANLSVGDDQYSASANLQTHSRSDAAGKLNVSERASIEINAHGGNRKHQEQNFAVDVNEAAQPDGHPQSLQKIFQRLAILKAIETLGQGARTDREPRKNFSEVNKDEAAKRAGVRQPER